MDASDDRSRLWGREVTGAGRRSAFWGPDFNEALFFLGTALTYKIRLCVRELEEGVVMFFFKKKQI